MIPFVLTILFFDPMTMEYEGRAVITPTESQCLELALDLSKAASAQGLGTLAKCEPADTLLEIGGI